MLSLYVAGFGIIASLPVFWMLPTAFLSGAAGAAGIAVINSIGNLGFAGPFAMGGSRTIPAATPADCCFWQRSAPMRSESCLMIGRDDAPECIPAAE
jgi:ACS family tartrate transporter-like MFS transporter